MPCSRCFRAGADSGAWHCAGALGVRPVLRSVGSVFRLLVDVVAIILLVLALPVIAWILSEVRWASVNNPEGKFTNTAGYLAHGRLPERTYCVDRDGERFLLALGPLDTWLAFPSGPAAYVFNDDGDLVDWTRDIGDDAVFRDTWRDLITGVASAPLEPPLAEAPEGTP